MTSSSGPIPAPSAPALDRDGRDRLAAAKLWLVSTQSPTTCGNLPYLSTAVYALVPIASNDVRSMSVDQYWRLYVNPEWLGGADVPEIAALIAHLVWHLLMDHAGRATDLQVGPATAGAWRDATDATVAELLDPLPTGLARPETWGLKPGRSAEEYYAALSGLPVTKGDGDASPVEELCGSGADGLHRAHEAPPAAPVGGVGEADAAHIRTRVAIEFREHQIGIGTAPGEWSRWVGEVLDSVVPWMQVLSAAVRRGVGWVNGHTDYTYSRISRRQSSAGRIILPATRRPVPEVAVVVDTSGSVDDGLLAQALGEVDGVLSGLGVGGRSVTVLSTDAAVHEITRVRSGRDARISGGGGTDMGAGILAALELKPRPSLIIVLTDGWTPWPPPPPMPVVAVLIGRAREELPPTPAWIQRVECVPV